MNEVVIAVLVLLFVVSAVMLGHWYLLAENRETERKIAEWKAERDQISRRVAERRVTLQRVRQELFAELGREPTVAEIWNRSFPEARIEDPE